METECQECGKTFILDLATVYVSCEEFAPHDNIVVIKCPHCGKRHEF